MVQIIRVYTFYEKSLYLVRTNINQFKKIISVPILNEKGSP